MSQEPVTSKSSRHLVCHVDPQTNDGLTIEKEILAKVGAELIYAPTRSKTEDEVIAIGKEADAILVASAPMTRRVISSLQHCKVLVRYGIGVDNVDITAATEMGIAVVNVPDLYVEEVSNHTIMLLLALNRHLVSFHNIVNSGAWRHYPLPRTGRVMNQTLGIIGFGNIGQAVARKAQVFGLEILAYDPYLNQAEPRFDNVKFITLDTLLTNADYVTLHVPMTETTNQMIGEPQLDLMKPSSFLINTARGKLVNEDALVRALKGGKIAGAALDVFEPEPPSKNNPLLEMGNVILSPHFAFYSDYAFEQVRRRVAEEAASVLTRRIPRFLINRDVISSLKLVETATAEMRGKS